MKPHLLEQGLRRPGVAADVVLADQGDVVRRLRVRELARLDDVVTDGVVGDVVAERLGDAPETLAAAGDDGEVQLLRHVLRDGVDVVADQPHRALGEDRDPLGEREELLRLLQERRELLVAAVDDVLLLEVGRELHGEVGDAGDAGHEVAARPPRVPAAADRTVGDVDHVADRTPDDPLGARIGAATGAHHAWDRLPVRLDAGGA